MRWSLIPFFILISHNGLAQQYYETFSPANGLVDARVNKIVQDGQGRLFFLTKDGFSIYDGQRFTNHTTLSGIPIGIINDGLILPDGSLQLSAFNGQWIHCRKNSVELDSSFARSIPEVSEIISLPGDEKYIISNLGLFLVRNNTVKKIALAQPPGKVFERMAILKDQIVFNYYLERNTIYTAKKSTGEITDSIRIPQLYNLAVDHDGNLQLCTLAGILQVDNTELQKGKLKTGKPWFQDLIPHGSFAKNILFDRQKNVWLINDITGCLRLNQATGKIHLYSTKDGLLPGTEAMFQDNENNHWFIVPGKGVQKLVQTNYEIVNRIGSILIDGAISFNSAEDGSFFLFTTKKILVSRNDTVQELPRNQSLYYDPVFYWQKKYWTWASPGLMVNNSNKYIPLGTTVTNSTVPHFPSPYSGLDRYGNLLLAGNHISVIQKNYSASSKALPYFADNIVADERNDYWAFCRSDEVVKFRLSGNELIKQSSFIHNNIGPRYAIHFNKDTFWIATRQNGILIVKLSDRSLSVLGQLTREDGLSNDFVETLLKIDDKRIAAGTASGLDIITLAGPDTLVENVSSRINHFEPILQLTRDDKGMIYARTENLQIFKYDPFLKVPPDYNPASWLSKITVNGKLIDTTTTLFNYLNNNFLFSVTSPSFTDNRNILFRFTLIGEKRNWEQNSNKADFEISNLSPGNYELTVVTRYPGNIYEDKKLYYHFSINPPFWKTWWFISLVVLGITSLAIMVTRGYYKQRLAKREAEFQKQKALENERTRIATDMHDDFGASLSRIKFISEKMQVQQGDEIPFRADLEKISGYSDEMAEKLGEIVWALNQRYDSAGDLVSFCRSYASEYLEDKNIKLNFSTGKTVEGKLNGEVRRNIFLVIKEALHNIVKHANASQVNIEMSCGEILRVVIEDNGNGFDPAANRPFANGLENMKKRVKDIGGTLAISSIKGTRIEIIVEWAIRRNTYR